MPSLVRRDLRRALGRGLFVGGAFALIFGACRADAPTWALLGVSLALPFGLALRLERPPRAVPPLATLAGVFGIAFLIALFAFFEGAYLDSVRSTGSLRAAFETVGTLAASLNEPYSRHPWWARVLPWDEAWRRWEDPGAAIDAALLVATLATAHAAGRWLGAEARAREPRTRLCLRVAAAMCITVPWLVAWNLTPEKPPFDRARWGGAVTIMAEEDPPPGLLVFAGFATLVLAAAPLVDRVERRLFSDQLEPAGPEPTFASRLSRVRCGLALLPVLWLVGREPLVLARGDFSTLTFSRDGSLLAAGTGDGVRVFSTGRVPGSIYLTLGGPVTALAFSPDGRTLAANGEVWSIGERRRLYKSSGEVEGLAFSTDGAHLFEAQKGRIDVRSSRDGSLERSLTRPGDVSWGGIATVGVGGDRVLGSQCHCPRIWDASTGTLVWQSSLTVPNAVAVAPVGSLAAWVVGANKVEVRDLDGGLVSSFETKTEFCRRLAFSPDATRLALACDDREVQIRSVKDGALLSVLRDRRHRPADVAWSCRNKIASGGFQGSLRLWDPDKP